MMALSTIGLWPGSVVAQAGCDATVAAGESIQAAIDAAAQGDTVCVEPGTYQGNVEIDTANLTLRSTGGAHTTFIDPEGAFVGVRAMSGGLGDITVDGFTVLEDWIASGIGQGLAAGEGTALHAINNIVTAPVNTTAHGNAIQVTGDGSTVINNTVAIPHQVSPDWRGSGILLFGASNVLIKDNIATSAPQDSCIVLGGDNFGAPPAHNNTVEGNLAHGCGSGIVIEPGVHNTVITGNKVRDNIVGVDLLAGAPGVIELRHNHISGNGIGLENGDGNPTTDARWNYWGCPDGPADAACDSVVGNVTYDPWLTEPTYTGATDFAHDEDVVLETTLLDSNGDGVEGIEIEFFVDNESVGTGTTNGAGAAGLNVGPHDAGVYEVRADALCGCLVANATVVVQGQQPPPEPPVPVCGPENIRGRAEANPPTNVVAWDAFHNATSYNIERATGNGAFEPLGTTNHTEFHDDNVTVGTTYQYRVTALSGTWESESCDDEVAQITAIPVFTSLVAAVAAAAIGVGAYVASRRKD